MQLALIGIFFSQILLSVSFADEALLNFTAGEYILTKGKEAHCSSGEFKVYDQEGLKISFAGLHIFDLKNHKEKIIDDFEGKKECYYDAEDSMDVIGAVTHLAFKEVYKCKEQTQHILTRKAKITPGKIELDAVQEGVPKFNYQCVWTLNHRGVNSTPTSKKSTK